MDVQPTNLQQLRDAIISIWTKKNRMPKSHMPRRIKTVLKAKEGPSKMYLIKVTGKNLSN